MVERMKDPRCLIDAEALASHMSIVSSDPSDKGGKKKKKKGESSLSNSKQVNENSSATGMKQSESESGTEKISHTSMS
jgi:hypothetical protein